MRRGRSKKDEESQSRMRFRGMLPQHLFPFPAFFLEKKVLPIAQPRISSQVTAAAKKHKSVSLLANGKTRARSENEWNFLGGKMFLGSEGGGENGGEGKGAKDLD